MKFDWVFLKVIHLDVNSDVNYQPFTMWFCRQHRLVLRQLPCKFGEVTLTTSKVINAQHWANIVATSAERLLLISQSILNRFTCNFAHTIRSHYGDSPVNLKKFDQIFKSYECDTLKQHCFHVARALKMRAVIETALSKCPPSTCVTEQLELTGLVARRERVITNTTAT